MRATSPPAANCQARVGSEKNATEGTTKVAASDIANDTTATSASTTRYGRCFEGAEVVWALVCRRTSRMSHVVPMIKAGHTR